MASQNVQAATGSDGPPWAPKNWKKQLFSMLFKYLAPNIEKPECFFMLLELVSNHLPTFRGEPGAGEPPAALGTLGTILTNESCNIPKHTFSSKQNTHF
jgi:hypothetical protein